MPEAARVPTSPPPSDQRPGKAVEGWTLETAIDHLLALVNEKNNHVVALINEARHQLTLQMASHDRRYDERFQASQKALELGFQGQRSSVDMAFSAQKSAIDAALASADRAVTKAELATEKRFESVNEFRATLDQQQRTLIPRSEVDVLIRGLDEKIGNLSKLIDEVRARDKAEQSERMGVKGGWGYAVGVLGFVLTLLAIAVAVTTIASRML